MDWSVLLGATGKSVPVEVLGAGGERLLLPTVRGWTAFDGAVEREGWIAVSVRPWVWGLVDGAWLRPWVVEGVWVTPAVDPRFVVVQRYLPRESDAEPLGSVVEMLDARGRVVRSVECEVRNVCGELASGRLVSWDGLVGWDGVVSPLGVAGFPEAVVAGRFVVMSERTREHRAFRVWDTDTGRVSEHDQAEFRLEAYDPRGMNAVGVDDGEPGFFWVSQDGVASGVECGFEPHSLVFVGEGRVLAVGDRDQVVVDLASGGVRAVAPALPRRASPRANAAGRFRVEALAARLAAPWTGAIPADQFTRLRADSHTRAQRIAGETGVVDVDDRVELGVRLRSCVAGKRIAVGASKLGGRPDLPAGHRWPRHGGQPMALLAQLRLEELAAAFPEAGLPTSGLLTVFAAIDADSADILDEDGVRVEVLPDGPVKRRAWPAALDEELRYEEALAVAEPTHTATPADPTGTADPFVEAMTPEEPGHQVLGAPATIQEHKAPAGYRLLLQLEDDAITGYRFGGGGYLKVWQPAGAALNGIVAGCRAEIDAD